MILWCDDIKIKLKRSSPRTFLYTAIHTLLIYAEILCWTRRMRIAQCIGSPANECRFLSSHPEHAACTLIMYVFHLRSAILRPALCSLPVSYGKSLGSVIPIVERRHRQQHRHHLVLLDRLCSVLIVTKTHRHTSILVWSSLPPATRWVVIQSSSFQGPSLNVRMILALIASFIFGTCWPFAGFPFFAYPCLDFSFKVWLSSTGSNACTSSSRKAAIIHSP